MIDNIQTYGDGVRIDIKPGASAYPTVSIKSDLANELRIEQTDSRIRLEVGQINELIDALQKIQHRQFVMKLLDKCNQE